MDFKERMYSILIVSAAEKFNTSLLDMFPDSRYHPIQLETSINSAKRALLEREYDLIVINSPLPDNDGIRFSIDVSGGKRSIVLLLVRGELYTSVFDKVSSHGVYVLSKPTSRQSMSQCLDWMITSCEKFKKMEKKTLSLEDKMQEIRIVNRAKWLLIAQIKMNETDAHHFIEKQAMDRCISKREIAEEIIKTYS